MTEIQADQGEPPTPSKLYFFLSYARSDDDVHVEQFYRDLCKEVRVYAGLNRDVEVGFFDNHSIGLGATWSDELVDALSRSFTFVALCSPRYYASEPCGREWQLFASRVRDFEATRRRRSRAIVPVMWLPPRKVPEAVKRVQYDSDAFGEAYRDHGLRQLMRLRRNHDEYVTALSILAQHIVDNAQIDPLPEVPEEERFAFEDLVSAFDESIRVDRATVSSQQDPPRHLPPKPRKADVVTPSAADPGRPTTDTDSVEFVIAAPNRAEAASVRAHLEFYRATSSDWAPYHPEFSSPLEELAREVAARRGFTARVSGVPAAGEAISVASQHRAIVVLLVDAWAPQLPRYHDALMAYESRHQVASAMVPRNPADEETTANWSRLSAQLHAVFAKRILTGDPVSYRQDILSHGAFDEDLQVVLETAKNRVFAKSRPPTDPPATSRPILEGP